MSLAAWLLWLSLSGDTHADAEQLRAAAKVNGVPSMVMLGVAAVETGYKGGNGFQGKAGEVGRMQVQEPTARAAGCPDPVNLADYAYNIDCGARVLRWCRGRNPDWSAAIMCYNSSTLSAPSIAYLQRVEREIGRQQLARLR